MFLSRGGHCGKGIYCGFPIHAVKEILSIVNPELSVNDLKSKTSVLNESCYQPFIDVVKLACTKHSAEGHSQDITETDGSSEGSSSSSDSESDIDFKKYHARIGDSFEDDI